MYIFEEKLLSTKNPARQEPMYIFEELFSLNALIKKVLQRLPLFTLLLERKPSEKFN